MSLRFARLDRPSIRRLKPGEKLAEHGITAECLADGDLRWTVNVMVDGRRVHRVVGRDSDGVTRTQCEEFIGQARTDARHGRLNLPAGRKLALTFATAADDYLKRLEQSGGRNMVAKRRHLRAASRASLHKEGRPEAERGHLIAYFGAMRLDAITGFTIEKYKKQRRDQQATPGTINREIATLSHLLNRAVEWRWLDRLPTRPAKFKETGARIIALTDDECDALMTAAVASADPDLWLFVAIALNTAMRHGEIMAMRWDQLDLVRCRLFVPDAKAGQREQPITPELAELLAREREMRDDRVGWIFPSPHKDSAAGHRARMDKPFDAAAKAAGLDPVLITPHVMRHTAITKLVEAGADLPTIQRISGHKTLTMVLRYTHVHGSHIDKAISALGRTLPQRPANEGGAPITPKLHTAVESRSRKRPKKGEITRVARRG